MTAPHAIYLRDVEPERLRWLSRGRLAIGKLTVLDGDPGLGKSTMLTDWAARISRGEALPDGDPAPPRGVVLLSAEDGLADTIRPRLEAAGADLARVVALVAVPDPADPTGAGRLPAIPLDLPHVERLIADCGAALLIVDPLMAYLGEGTNAHRDQDVRRALAPLAHLAERTGVAVVLVRHLNKAASANALYRGGGSIGIIGAARVGLLVAADPDDPERRIVAVTKGNLAKPPASLAFHLEAIPGGDVARVVWDGGSPHTAGSLLDVPSSDEDRAERDQERGARAEARDWLREVLRPGPLPAREVMTAATKDGIAPRTLDRAKADLGVVANRVGGVGAAGRWVWTMPDGLRSPPIPPNPGGVGGLSAIGDVSIPIVPESPLTPLTPPRAPTPPTLWEVGGLGGVEGSSVTAWARELAAYSDDELDRYRAELDAAPAADPPHPDEIAALRLVWSMRSMEARNAD